MRPTSLSAAVLFFLCCSFANAQVTYQRVALRGDPVGGAEGVNVRIYLADSTAVMNDAGQVAFHAALITDNEYSGATGIFRWQPSGLLLVAQEGSIAPGTGGAKFNFLNPYPTLNEEGTVGFSSSFTAAGVGQTNGQGIWTANSAGATLAVRTGSAAPQWPGGFLDGLGVVRVTDDDQIFFSAVVSDPAAPFGQAGAVYFGQSGDFSLVLRSNTQAPDAPVGTNLSYINNVQTSDKYRTAIAASISGAAPGESKQVMYRGGSPSDLLIAAGGAAPGTTGDFASFDALAINHAGRLVFNAHLTGDGIDDSNDEGIWFAPPGAPMQLVARIGDPAPHTPAGTKYSANDHSREDQWDPLSQPTINATGQIAFRARFDGAADATNNWGIYAGAPDDLHLIARSGDDAPGVPNAKFKGSIVGGEWIAPFDPPLINNAGQVAFIAALVGDGIEDFANQALYATDPSGQLHLIVRAGQLFDVGGGDLHRIVFVGFSPNDDSIRGASTFNSNGQLLFTLAFDDNSNGIFIATVPEPAAAVLTLLPAGWCLVSRKMRQRSFS